MQLAVVARVARPLRLRWRTARRQLRKCNSLFAKSPPSRSGWQRSQAFLHDAGLSDPFTYDRATHTFRLPLGRIGYEFRQKRSALGFLRVWAMPFVPAILTVEPVDLDLTEEEPGVREDFDQLMAIGMPDPTLLELWHRGDREGVIRLRCTPDTSLTIADTGPAEARLAIRSLFTLIVPEQIVTDIVNTSVA